MKSVIIIIVLYFVKIICLGQDTIIYTKTLQINASINIDRCSNITNVQKDKNPVILKISPLQIVFGDFITNSLSIGLSIEKAIKKPYSFHMGARYIFREKRDIFDKSWIVINVSQINGLAVDAEIRRYLSKDKKKMAGGYLSANLKPIYTKAIYHGYKVNRLSTATYLNIGWQEIFDSGVVFDVAIGIGAKYVISNSNTDPNSISISRHIMDGGKKPYHTGWAFFPFVNLNLNLGYAFRNN